MGWYWRLVKDGMSVAHGSATSRDGVVDQIVVALRTAPLKHITTELASRVELVIQPPERGPNAPS